MPDLDFECDVELIIRPMPDPVPAGVRLRRLLKVMLRCYGFELRSYRPVESNTVTDGPGGPKGASES